MRQHMIFDTQGTGFFKKAARQMMAQPEIPYLSGLAGEGWLGDEIMLLSGIDDLGAAYPHGFDDGPARTWTMPSPDRSTMYQFDTGPVETGMSGARLGASVGSLGDGWPKQRPRNEKPPFHFTGFGTPPDYHYSGLGDWPVQQSRYAKRTYRYSGLEALGEADPDINAYRIGAVVALGAAYFLGRRRR